MASQRNAPVVPAIEQANFEAGIDSVGIPATAQINEDAATVEQPNDIPANQDSDTEIPEPGIPEDEDPYAGLTPEQKEVRILEEKASEMALAYKIAADAANAKKAEIAKQQKLLDDYYALVSLVSCGDEALGEALSANKQAIITCLKEQRIKVGPPQPIPQHGSIGLHHSNNGSKIIDGSSLPEKKERKITPEIAAQCRYERANGLATIAELAARYGVKEGYMGNVVRGVRGTGR